VTWSSLGEVGNLSSMSVLMLLEETLATAAHQPIAAASTPSWRCSTGDVPS